MGKMACQPCLFRSTRCVHALPLRAARAVAIAAASAAASLVGWRNTSSPGGGGGGGEEEDMGDHMVSDAGDTGDTSEGRAAAPHAMPRHCGMS